MARIYNTFGPRMHMDDGRVVSSLILQALRSEPMTVMYAVCICSMLQICNICIYHFRDLTVTFHRVILINLTWSHFDQPTEQLVVGHTTITVKL